jgi:hypothetical protein
MVTGRGLMGRGAGKIRDQLYRHARPLRSLTDPCG